MGFFAPAEALPEVLTVATVKGRAFLNGKAYPKASLWVLEDRTAVLCVPGGEGNGGVYRMALGVDTAVWRARSKMLSIELSDNAGLLSLDARGCGCGMGAVGNAGPFPGPYQVVRVREPEWYTIEMA